jgi:hypothetical protein
MEPHEPLAESGAYHRIVIEDLPARRPQPGTHALPGRRLRRSGLVALVCVVAAAVLGREIAAAPRGTTYTPPPPGPVVLLSNVSFGKVTLNGKGLTGPPPLVLPLVNGMNAITFTAPPFAPRTCRVTQTKPGQVSGDCLLRAIEHTFFNIGGRVVHPSVAVVARFTGSDLSPDLYATARAVVAGQLAAAGGGELDVPPGEPIATGGTWPYYIERHPAGSEVRATLRYGLFDDGSTLQRQTDCGLSLCGDTLFYTTASASRAPAWNVSPDAYYTWSFRERSGNQESSLVYPVSPAVTIALTYDAAQGWQPLPSTAANLSPGREGFNLALQALRAALDPGICGAGLFLLTAMTAQLTEYATKLNTGGSPGCAYSLRNGGGQDDGIYIWRFGVLLAADSEAQALLRGLPVASAAEVAEATR